MLSPGKANVGIIPAQFFKPGNVGVVSRSGTLTYQIGNELARSGFGNSTIVGIGGDPVPGSSFVDIIALFEADPETELIVMSGEIGGSAEEEAAAFIAEHVSKPVVGYIAGLTAPPGKTMGHAGAIVSGSSGGGQAKIDALEARRRARRADADPGGRDRDGDPRRVVEPDRGGGRRAMARYNPRRSLRWVYSPRARGAGFARRPGPRRTAPVALQHRLGAVLVGPVDRRRVAVGEVEHADESVGVGRCASGPRAR